MQISKNNKKMNRYGNFDILFPNPSDQLPEVENDIS